MGIRKWLSRNFGSYSMRLASAEEVIKDILNDREILKIMKIVVILGNHLKK